MKKRKMLAVLMAAVIVIASLPGLDVYAAIGKEAQACKDLEILIGADASGVTSNTYRQPLPGYSIYYSSTA